MKGTCGHRGGFGTSVHAQPLWEGRSSKYWWRRYGTEQPQNINTSRVQTCPLQAQADRYNPLFFTPKHSPVSSPTPLRTVVKRRENEVSPPLLLPRNALHAQKSSSVCSGWKPHPQRGKNHLREPADWLLVFSKGIDVRNIGSCFFCMTRWSPTVHGGGGCLPVVVVRVAMLSWPQSHTCPGQ